MRKFGLIGYPLGHSFSRQYFTDKFSRENIARASYDNYPIDKIEKLPGLIEREKSLIGLNVTIPYKTSVIRYLDYIEREAEIVGAVNVIRIDRQNGRYKLNGFNSDIYGFRESLLPYLAGDRSKCALILGTGGSSLAVRYVLKNLGFSCVMVSRTLSENNITYKEITDKMLSDCRIIVNTTPLGMYPSVDSCPDINYSALSGSHILYDLVYNPEITRFLSLGKERGCTVIGGLQMLHLQAEKSWSIWNESAVR